MRAKRELIRIVRTPAGEIRVDPTGKLSGRGAYVCAERACVDRALGEGRLTRSLERAIPAEAAESLRASLSRPAPPRAPVVRRITLERASHILGTARSQKPQGAL
jgi:predicted RNA-binding protein YlxR (DUF448 family)